MQTKLDGLDDIPWSDLTHAYGSAADVPLLLRKLASEDDGSNPDSALYGNIFHQGSRYEATVYAIPFLAEIALNRECEWYLPAMDLLISVAIGFDDTWLPKGFNIREFRRQVDEWQQQPGDEEDPFKHGPNYELACYEAVNTHIPSFIDVLRSRDHGPLEYYAVLLAWFPDHAEVTVPLLNDKAEQAEANGVHENDIASCLIAIGLLLNVSDMAKTFSVSQKWLANDSEMVRAAAAIAMVAQYDDDKIKVIESDEKLPTIIQALQAIVDDYGEYEEDWIGGLNGGDFAGVCQMTLDRLPKDFGS